MGDRKAPTPLPPGLTKPKPPPAPPPKHYAPELYELGVKWVRVTTELLPLLRDWSVPVQVRITGEENGELQMEFRRHDERTAIEQKRAPYGEVSR